jgi:2'-5' RNA ligase
LPQIEVALGGLEVLGNPWHGRALSILLEPEVPSLVEAMAAVRPRMLEIAGSRPEDRTPLPHVTLARIGWKVGKRVRTDAIRWAKAIDLESAQVRLDRLALFTWDEEQSSGHYVILDSHECSRESSPG